MAEQGKPWFLRASTRWIHFRTVPFKRLWVLMTAVFLLFSVIGFYVDLNGSKGETPYSVVVAVAIFSGLNAALWISWNIRTIRPPHIRESTWRL